MRRRPIKLAGFENSPAKRKLELRCPKTVGTQDSGCLAISYFQITGLFPFFPDLFRQKFLKFYLLKLKLNYNPFFIWTPSPKNKI